MHGFTNLGYIDRWSFSIPTDPEAIYFDELQTAPRKPRYCRACGHRLADSNPHKHCYKRECWPQRGQKLKEIRAEQRPKKQRLKDRRAQQARVLAEKGYPDLITGMIEEYKKHRSTRIVADVLVTSHVTVRTTLHAQGVEMNGAGGDYRRYR